MSTQTTAARALLPLALTALLASGAIFGFFYAWVCSTMWGLDDADPQVAIAAMQAMNASVRNWVFAPVFFGTPLLLLATAAVARRCGRPQAARWFLVGAVIYLLGGLLLTLTINVPMNEELATHALPLTDGRAATIWQDYSGPWQLWNTVRTVASAVALLCAGLGLLALGSRSTGEGSRDGESVG